MQKYAHQPAPKRVEILNQANQYLKGPLLCFGKPPSGTIYPDKYRVPPHLKPQNSLNPQYQGGLNIQRSVLKPSEPELNSEQAQVPKFKALQQYLYKATTETSQPSQNGAQVLNPSGAQPLQVPSQNLSSDQATRSPILTPPNLGDEAQRDTLSGNFGQAQQVGQDRGHDDLKDSLVSEETLEKMSEIVSNLSFFSSNPWSFWPVLNLSWISLSICCSQSKMSDFIDLLFSALSLDVFALQTISCK